MLKGSINDVFQHGTKGEGKDADHKDRHDEKQQQASTSRRIIFVSFFNMDRKALITFSRFR